MFWRYGNCPGNQMTVLEASKKNDVTVKIKI
jgi:hypothetical protein